jgi:predicted AAA+ superfamily ATPase
LQGEESFFLLGGYAGTGKSSIIFAFIRPLAKVANDRHNLAQIARNCRYQQLN